ncbi:hypothetical protein Dimus_013517, partial [Dionaea muscipula]
MVGRRRTSFQKRVREVACDPSSPDPHCRGLTRGSPSPAEPHFRWGPPSPGLRKHRRRTPSPLLLSSPDPAEVSSSENGEATVEAVSASEDEDHAGLGGGRMDSALFFKATSFPEESDRSEGSARVASSNSSTISPTTAVLLCQTAIDAGGADVGRLKLARADSVDSVSSPSVGGCPLVSDGARLEVADGDGGQGCADLVLDSVSLNCISPPAQRAPSVCESLMVREGLEHTVADCADAPSIVMAGVSLTSFRDVIAGQGVSCDKVSPSSDCLIYSDTAMAGGEVIMVVQPKTVGSKLLGVAGTVCDSSIPSIGVSTGRVGDGLVSEVGRVSPVAREALRPQPTDGLRQPPSSPVDPVIGTEGGG